MPPETISVFMSVEVETVNATPDPNAIVPTVFVPVVVVRPVPLAVPNPVMIVPRHITLQELPEVAEVPAVRTVTDILRTRTSEMNERPPEVPFAPAVLTPRPMDCRVR